ncbi:MAG: HAD family hydrolase [Burkholderiaceae bacterium]
MNLALFDLDYTLLPIDSDHSWSEFLGDIGVIDGAEHKRRNDQFFEQYKAGTLIIEEFLAFQLAPLAAHDRRQLNAWHDRFMAERILPAIRPAARDLVRRHQQAGDLCAIVTATNEFVTGPIARAFGVDHLIAIELETDAADRYTGRHRGVPSFREGKITRTNDWLAGLGHALPDFDQSWFYSDSLNDLPLLDEVSDPVATNPDPRLEALARDRQWPILKLFEDAAT